MLCKPVTSFQNTKFALAAVVAQVEAPWHVLDHGIVQLGGSELSVADAGQSEALCTGVQRAR